MKVIGLILLLLSTPAFAANSDCSSVRLDAPGGSMEHVGVRLQYDQPICYAESGSELADAWIFSHGEDSTYSRSSAIEAALGNTVQHVSKRHEGEPPGVTMWYGPVIEDFYSQSRVDDTSIAGGDACDVVDYLRRNGSYSALGLDFDQLDTLLFTSYWATSPNNFRRLHEMYFSGPRRKHALGECHVYLPPLSESNYYEGFLKKIHQRLTSPSAQPIAMAFDDKVLERGLIARKPSSGESLAWRIPVIGPFIRMGFIQDNLRSYDGTHYEGHFALIIGQRELGGKCQLLIRNSWQGGCARYSKDWECESDGESIWVDAHVLSQNILSLEYLGGD